MVLRRLLLALFLTLAMLAPAQAEEKEIPSTLLGTKELAKQLTATLRGAEGLEGRRIAVLPFVDMNDLQVVSDFGRLVGEELASALHFRHFHLAEIRSDDQLLMARGVGELFLARTGPERGQDQLEKEVIGLADEYNLGGLVVGTYGLMAPDAAGSAFADRKSSEGLVSLNARLIDLSSGAVLAVGTVKVKADESVYNLLRRRTSAAPPPVSEIKVKRY